MEVYTGIVSNGLRSLVYSDWSKSDRSPVRWMVSLYHAIQSCRYPYLCTMSASHKEILRLAIPNIISNVSIPLLSTVDTILMGQLSALHLGAIGLGGMIFNFVYWNFGFLRMGTTGLTAQAYGAKQDSRVGVTLVRGALLAFLLALILWVTQGYLLDGASWFFAVSDAHDGLVAEYFTVRMYAAPATMLMYVLMGWFFGLQNAWIPMLITIAINIVNIIISYLLVYQYGMEIRGVALGTVIAQYVGLVLCIAVVLVRYRHYLQAVAWKAVTQFTEVINFFKVNSNLFIRTVCLTFVFAFFYRESSIAGALALAANVILLQFVNWMSYGIDGFAYAAESMVGKYEGARRADDLSKSIRLSFLWGLVLALIYAAVYFLFYDQLLHLFSGDEEVIAFAQLYKYWMVVFPILAFACYIWDGIFIGLLASRQMRDSMVIALVLFMAVYQINTADPLTGLWLSMIVFMVARGILLTLYYYFQRPSAMVSTR